MMIHYELGNDTQKQHGRKWLIRSIVGVSASVVLGMFSLRSAANPSFFLGAVNEPTPKTDLSTRGSESHDETSQPTNGDRRADLENYNKISLSSLRLSNMRRHPRQLYPNIFARASTTTTNASTATDTKVRTGTTISKSTTESAIPGTNTTGNKLIRKQAPPTGARSTNLTQKAEAKGKTTILYITETTSTTRPGKKNGRRVLSSGRDVSEAEYFIGTSNFLGVPLADDDDSLLQDPEATELMEGENPCNKVDPVNIGDNIESRKKCKSYLSLPYIIPECTGEVEKVPKIFHSVGHNNSQSHHQFATASANPDFLRHHLGDLEALEYIRERCGTEAAEAYKCLAPPAYRGDLFRFCALYSEGGVYLDEDIFPIYPLKDLYSPCSTATIGHDYPQSKPGMQMKILAGAPGAPIFKCAFEKIIERVRNREYPRGGPLELSGPLMLHECYEKHSEDVAITYHDTRNAQYPFSGMRQGTKILAYEVPSEKRHMLQDPEDYAFLFYERKVYRETCPLKPNNSFPSVAERVKYYMGRWYDKGIEVNTNDLCQSVWYYHSAEGILGPEDESLYLQPYLFNKDTLARDVYFNSTLRHLVPWLRHPEKDPLLLHFTEGTPNILYPFPVITNSRSIEPGKIDPYFRLPLIAPLRADVQFGPLHQVQEHDILWEKKKDSLLRWSDEEDDEAFSYHLRSNPILMKKQLAHKYVLSLEGDDVPAELSWKLYSNSVVFMPLPKYVSWAMEDKLVPFYHYIPLKDDLSDLDEKIEWARKNDAKCKLIAQRATEYLEDLWMSEKAQSETFAILEEMVRRYQSQYGKYLSSCKKPSTATM